MEVKKTEGREKKSEERKMESHSLRLTLAALGAGSH